jgi:hypothetical protein
MKTSAADAGFAGVGRFGKGSKVNAGRSRHGFGAAEAGLRPAMGVTGIEPVTSRV